MNRLGSQTKQYPIELIFGQYVGKSYIFLPVKFGAN
jgi:hypothetical protein